MQNLQTEWTPDQIARCYLRKCCALPGRAGEFLADLLDAGGVMEMGLEELAVRYGVTKPTIINWRRHAGLQGLIHVDQSRHSVQRTGTRQVKGMSRRNRYTLTLPSWRRMLVAIRGFAKDARGRMAEVRRKLREKLTAQLLRFRNSKVGFPPSKNTDLKPVSKRVSAADEVQLSLRLDAKRQEEAKCNRLYRNRQ